MLNLLNGRKHNNNNYYNYYNTHSHTQQINGPLSTHTHPDHQTSFINFLHLLRPIASSVFNLRVQQSFSTTRSRSSSVSSSWSGTIYFILHTFLNPIITFLSTHMPIPSQPNRVIHTHPFNGPLSGTTRVSRCQKGKTNLDFAEATESEWQWHQLGHMQVCTSLQADNHASTPSLSFYRQDALPAAQPTASTH